MWLSEAVAADCRPPPLAALKYYRVCTCANPFPSPPQSMRCPAGGECTVVRSLPIAYLVCSLHVSLPGSLLVVSCFVPQLEHQHTATPDSQFTLMVAAQHLECVQRCTDRASAGPCVKMLCCSCRATTCTCEATDKRGTCSGACAYHRTTALGHCTQSRTQD